MGSHSGSRSRSWPSPAANADSARIGFGSFDITCEGDIWDVSDVMARRGITEFYLAEVGVTDFILTVEHDPATSALVDVIAELRRIGYGAYVIGAEGI